MEIYQGLVLAQRTAGDRGKFIDILTEKNTIGRGLCPHQPQGKRLRRSDPAVFLRPF